MTVSVARELLKKLIETQCIVTQSTRTGFMPSGTRAAWVFDFKQILLNGDALDLASTLIWDRIPKDTIWQIGGMETTAIGLIAGVVMKAKEDGTVLNGFYTRKSRKKDGLQRVIEGALTDDDVILIDDILNTGGSLQKQIDILALMKKKVRMVCTIVRFRSEAHYQHLRAQGIEVISLFSLDDFPVTGGVAKYEAENTLRGPARMESPFTSLWKFRSTMPNFYYVLPKSAPILDDTHVYMGTDNGTMWAINQSDGAVAWQFDTRFGSNNKRIFSSPALHDGTLYFGSYDGTLYALDTKTGAKKWAYMEADWIGSSPTVAKDLGMVFVGLEFGLWRKQGGVAALDTKTGKKKWWHQSETLTHSSPAYSRAHNTVVVGSLKGEIFALNAKNGSLKWTFTSEGPVRASFAIDDKRGIVCFGSEDRFFYCLDIRTGTVIFKTESFEGFYSTPLIHGDHVYIGCLDKRVLCIDLNNGKIVWSTWTNGRIFASPEHVEGHLYIGSNDGRLYELDPLTGKEISSAQFTERIVNKIAYNPSTKRFFVPTHGNELYCLERKAL